MSDDHLIILLVVTQNIIVVMTKITVTDVLLISLDRYSMWSVVVAV